MTNKLTKLLANKPSGLLNIFFTAGYPKLDDTVQILKSLEFAGVDLVEIGIPFSDPLADGPTIQESSKIALENGMSIEILFDQLAEYKSSIPVLLMGYLNPIMQHGVERFCKKCCDLGIDGLIVPDLPMNIYLQEFREIFEKYNLCNIFLVTPQTSQSRIREIDEHSTGFIYAVSSASTTGTKADFNSAGSYLAELKELKLKTPILTGFNIKTSADFKEACKYVDGAIIGSEFIRQISTSSNLEERIPEFVKQIKGN